MLRTLFALTLLLLSLCCAANAHARFSDADLAGTWDLFLIEADDTPRSYWISGSLALDENGDMTSGNWTAQFGNSGDFTAGSFQITPQGLLTGNASLDNGVELSVSHGWLDPNKQTAFAVAQKDDGNMDTITLVRRSLSDGQTADLAGSWQGCFYESRLSPAEMQYLIQGDLNINSSGQITGGSWEAIATGTTGTFTGGNVALSASGFLSGDIVSSDATTLSIDNGRMRLGKDVVASVSTKNSGATDVSILIRSGGDYADMDLSGRWAAYITEINTGPSPNTVYWIRGLLDLNSDGTLKNGSWTAVSGTTGTFSDVQLDLQDTGTFNGTMTLSNTMSMDVEWGFMSFDGSVAVALADKDEGDYYDLIYLVRMPDLCAPQAAYPLLLN